MRRQRPAGPPGSRCTGCGVSGDCCCADRVPGAVLACPPMAPDLDLDAASLSHPGRIPAERTAAAWFPNVVRHVACCIARNDAARRSVFTRGPETINRRRDDRLARPARHLAVVIGRQDRQKICVDGRFHHGEAACGWRCGATRSRGSAVRIGPPAADQLIADTASQTATSSDGDRQQNPQVLCRPCIW